jgi:hypothetical protein
MGLTVPVGAAEAALAWNEPTRTTAIARLAAERVTALGHEIECVWTGRTLSDRNLDIDHCLPWSAWPCGDLWNLAPSDRAVNQHQKRDRLPSAAIFAESRDRIIGWWEKAYLADQALAGRFAREVAAALPVSESGNPMDIFAAMDWRRLKLLQDQRLPEWTR